MRGLPLLILLGGLLVVSPAASAWSADLTRAADVHGLTFAPGTLRVIGEGVLIQFPMEGGAPLSWHEIRGNGEGGEFRVDLWPVPYGPANPVRYQLLSSNSALYLFDWIEGDLVTLPWRDGAELWEWDELPNADVVILEWTRTAVDVRVVAVDASDGTPLWEVERGPHGYATESLLPYDGSHAIMFSHRGSELLIVGREGVVHRANALGATHRVVWSPDANQFAAVHAGEIFGEEARLALYDAELNLVTLTSVAPETHVIGFAEHGRRLVVGRPEVAELFSSAGGRLLMRVGEVGLPGWVEGADSWFDAGGMTFAYEAGGYLQWADLANLRLLERTNVTALDIAVDPARGVVAGASTGQVWTNESRTLSPYAGIPWNQHSCISRGFNGGSGAWGSIRFEATDGHLVAAAPWHPRLWSDHTSRLDVESVALAFAPNAAVSQDARRPPDDEYLILELRSADSRADVCNGRWLREPPRAPVPVLPAMFLVAALFVCAPLCRRRR